MCLVSLFIYEGVNLALRVFHQKQSWPFRQIWSEILSLIFIFILCVYICFKRGNSYVLHNHVTIFGCGWASNSVKHCNQP